MENTNLTPQDIARAIGNDAAQATRFIKLGERTFPVLDLEYDDYVTYMALMEPLLQAVVTAVASRVGVEFGSEISPQSIIKHCAKVLPEMVRLSCKASDPDITVEEVKRLGKTPFVLAAAALQQIVQNNMVKDFQDFFGQIAPLMKETMGATKNHSMTKATPSS